MLITRDKTLITVETHLKCRKKNFKGKFKKQVRKTEHFILLQIATIKALEIPSGAGNTLYYEMLRKN